MPNFVVPEWMWVRGNARAKHRNSHTFSNVVTPAQRLLGVQLKDWKVLQLIGTDEASTGGFFSSQYRVQNVSTGQQAFLKAIDLHKRPTKTTPEEQTDVIARGIRHFHYESKLLQLCDGKKLDRVVRALDSGIHIIEIPEHGATLQVPYIVFEEAKADLRHHPQGQTFNLAWRLRIFHGVAVAVAQLHSAEIAHQDLKPSNVLVFEDDFAKVGDLGRATDRQIPSDYQLHDHAGDRNYYPFELLYGEYSSTSWERRRLGADLFMMGCVLAYLMCDASFLVLTFERLDKQFWPARWGGEYKAVVPHLQAAIEDVLREIEDSLPADVGPVISALIYQLCNPDPRARGWPHQCDHGKWTHAPDVGPVLAQYDLSRTISRFDFLATRAKTMDVSKRAPENPTRFWEWFVTNNR